MRQSVGAAARSQAEVAPEHSQIHSNTVDLSRPFKLSDLPACNYTFYADASPRSEEPALKSQWLGGAISEDGAETLSLSLDDTKTVRLTLKPVDLTAVLPCTPVRNITARKSLVQRFTEPTGPFGPVADRTSLGKLRVADKTGTH